MESNGNICDVEMAYKGYYNDLKSLASTHQAYLKDVDTINFFKNVIDVNKHLFKGKTVLNLSCGIGILSLFAAKAGARLIFAVDADESAIEYTKQVVKANKLEHIIQPIQGQVDNIVLPVENVDIILSDWIGYSLIFDAHCYAVIYARNKWLKKGGDIIPDLGHIHIRGFTNENLLKDRVDWWTNVYDFNMGTIQRSVLTEPYFSQLHMNDVATDQWCIKTIDLNEATYEDIQIQNSFVITAQKSDDIHGLFTYFDLTFSKSHVYLNFSTDVCCRQTRFLHSIFLFETPIVCPVGESICGNIEIKPSDPSLWNLHKVRVHAELCDGAIRQKWLFNSIDSSNDLEIEDMDIAIDDNFQEAAYSDDNSDEATNYLKRKTGDDQMETNNNVKRKADDDQAEDISPLNH